MLSESEFNALIADTKKVVLAAIFRYLPAELTHSIDDVAQEVYYRAYRHLQQDKFRSQAKIKTWLYAIAKNESLRLAQKSLREQAKFFRFKQTLELGLGRMNRGGGFKANLVNGFEQENDALTEFSAHTLEKIMTKLPQRYQRLFHYVLEGKSDAEIAEAMNIAPGTVKSRKSRGKEKMLRIARQMGLPELEGK